jgi:hypothetical protein
VLISLKKKIVTFYRIFQEVKKKCQIFSKFTVAEFSPDRIFRRLRGQRDPQPPPPQKKIKQFDELCFLWEGERPVDPEVSKKCPIFVTLTLIPNIFFDVFR